MLANVGSKEIISLADGSGKAAPSLMMCSLFNYPSDTMPFNYINCPLISWEISFGEDFLHNLNHSLKGGLVKARDFKLGGFVDMGMVLVGRTPIERVIVFK